MNYCVGIDIGGTTVKCGLFQEDGKLLDKWEVRTCTENNGERILPDVAESVLEKLQEKKIAKEAVIGAGVGVPGPVNDEGEIPYAVNLHWGYKHIAKELRKLLELPVRVGNDANVAALGEMWKGGGAGSQNLVMVTLGTGVGGGVILNGKMVAGAHGAGGEIGHACIDPKEPERCNCGNYGCLEQMASATGIVRLAKQELERSSQDSCLRRGNLSAKAVFDAYKTGDKLAETVIERFAEYLGTSLAFVAAVVDPEVFVIGGGVSKAGETLVECVRKYYNRDAFSACRETPIVLATLGNDAGIYGAAKLALG